MINHLIVTEYPELIPLDKNDVAVLTPDEYIENLSSLDLRKNTKLRVVNLCKEYDYLSKGYYCSLLAEARGQRCLPPIDTVVMMNWKRLYSNVKPELDRVISKYYKIPLEHEVAKTFIFYFGRSEDHRLEFLSRRIFDIFRFPLLSVELKFVDGRWSVAGIEPISLHAIPSSKLNFFGQALAAYTGKAWANFKKPVQEKFWLAILHNPSEKMAPSNKGALENFIRSAKRHNVFAELITKDDMSSLLEYEALFIRETTSIDHHTYRFAYKAEMEGLPTIDDTASIIRCSNKVFLNEVMLSKNVPVPRTVLLDQKKALSRDLDIEFPMILKVPDGSFSRGIVKVENAQEYKRALKQLFQKTDIILMQEYLPSEYDWRIGVLAGQPIFACRYYMAEGHWQIYNHQAKGKKKTGNHETLPLKSVPSEVLKIACKAASLVGDGLYGVDLKQNDSGIYVIEVNDNPSIDKGVEDMVEGNALYDRIVEHFVMLVEKS